MDWSGCVAKGTDVATLACVPVLFSNIINAALMFSGAVAIAFIVVSGLKLLTSGGDQKKVADAKGTLTWAIIGLVVILLSFAIIKFISVITGVNCIQTIGFTNCKN
jgi:hypothetical protein